MTLHDYLSIIVSMRSKGRATMDILRRLREVFLNRFLFFRIFINTCRQEMFPIRLYYASSLSSIQVLRHLEGLSIILGHYTVRSITMTSFNSENSVLDHMLIIEGTIRNHYSTDSCTSAAHIARELGARDIKISLIQVKRIRRRMGYLRANTKYCHLIRDVNKEKRKDFSDEKIENEETFSNYFH